MNFGSQVYKCSKPLICLSLLSLFEVNPPPYRDKMLPTHKGSSYMTLPEHSRGIPELAFLVSTDQDNSIFRRFEELSARNLLHMQAELIRMDDELHMLDRTKSHNMSYEEQIVAAAKRESLLSRLNVLMERYRAYPKLPEFLGSN